MPQERRSPAVRRGHGSQHARTAPRRAGAALLAALFFAPAPFADVAARADEALVPADGGARITEQTWLDERTFDATVDSPALGQSVKVRVLVPRGWSREASRTWPVVYAYHGGRDTYVSWTRSTDIEQLAAGQDVMVVMPEGGNGAYTDWWNDGKGGTPKWETFHTREVLQLMERNYRASGSGRERAAMGISAGASGAVTYAARHPGMFRYVAASSGILHLTQPGIPTLTLLVQGLYTDEGDPFRVWGVPGVDVENWLAHDPYVLARNLRGTGLYISTGTTGKPGEYDRPKEGEEEAVQVQEILCGVTTGSFLARLKALRIPVTSNVYADGWHNWEAWQPEMHRYWPAMTRAIGVP
ncbi:alpha/beta hydrolase [Actinomadura sp. 9N407]|uniref:alpha/beta hydrolase n=1 Tax=Actinomadura sp. 9N407 TaxID=3375154 RepID=UPI0037AD9ED9